MNQLRQWPRSWTHTVGREVARLRAEADMSAQRLSDACSEYGVDIPRNTITNLENGRKETLPVHELVALAAALLVDPAELLFPGAREPQAGPQTTVEYFPGDAIPAHEAWGRFIGRESPESVRIEQARVGAERVAQLLGEVQGRG